jgi:CxxC motif-containing protein (DUF1111 family)
MFDCGGECCLDCRRKAVFGSSDGLHTPTLAVNPGGTYTVPQVIGDKIIHPYSDFVLHDVGTADGTVHSGPQDTANKLRTPALWGLHIKSHFMHDLQTLTLGEAIQPARRRSTPRHSALQSVIAEDQQALLTFLRSL